MLHCVVLRCVLLCWLRCVVLCCVAMCCVALRCDVLHCVALCCDALWCASTGSLTLGGWFSGLAGPLGVQVGPLPSSIPVPGESSGQSTPQTHRRTSPTGTYRHRKRSPSDCTTIVNKLTCISLPAKYSSKMGVLQRFLRAVLTLSRHHQGLV